MAEESARILRAPLHYTALLISTATNPGYECAAAMSGAADDTGLSSAKTSAPLASVAIVTVLSRSPDDRDPFGGTGLVRFAYARSYVGCA